MNQKSDILFDEVQGQQGNLGLITLNRPEALNALNHAMFHLLDRQLTAWATDDHIKAVVIQAVPGKAFCAGGDIRYAYEQRMSNDPTRINFFGDEYRLDQYIYHYPKPYIALLDGITMGGGVGISIHGSHRVATDRLVFSMPETGIGFFPDVGATYFLPRLPGKIGYYAGLTGARLSYSDCLAVGLVDYVVSQGSFPAIIQALADASFTQRNDPVISGVIQQFSRPVEKSSLMEAYQPAINLCFSKPTIEDILRALEQYPDGWCQKVYAILQTKSPTSLKITLQQLQTGGTLSFDECMKLEYRLTSRFIEGHDFFEGIRAVIIDKDQKPRWNPAKLEEVSLHDVEKYFAPLEKELVG
jgi:enoyl-CoA hydratase